MRTPKIRSKVGEVSNDQDGGFFGGRLRMGQSHNNKTLRPST